mmetsp:Transcript_6975/g.16657  ORF Transcript_6975/g.16657 Transcript_6975/m.16657 type:complete len:310 (-) Transcript_6975:191-1120(-)
MDVITKARIVIAVAGNSSSISVVQEASLRIAIDTDCRRGPAIVETIPITDWRWLLVSHRTLLTLLRFLIRTLECIGPIMNIRINDIRGSRQFPSTATGQLQLLLLLQHQQRIIILAVVPRLELQNGRVGQKFQDLPRLIPPDGNVQRRPAVVIRPPVQRLRMRRVDGPDDRQGRRDAVAGHQQVERRPPVDYVRGLLGMVQDARVHLVPVAVLRVLPQDGVRFHPVVVGGVGHVLPPRYVVGVDAPKVLPAVRVIARTAQFVVARCPVILKSHKHVERSVASWLCWTKSVASVVRSADILPSSAGRTGT